jgi:hypothetical protein
MRVCDASCILFLFLFIKQTKACKAGLAELVLREKLSTIKNSSNMWCTPIIHQNFAVIYTRKRKRERFDLILTEARVSFEITMTAICSYYCRRRRRRRSRHHAVHHCSSSKCLLWLPLILLDVFVDNLLLLF